MWSQVTIFWETVGEIWETVLVPQNTLKKHWTLLGIKAGKFLGVRRIFVRIHSNVPEKFVSQKWLRLFLEVTQKMSSCVLWRRKKSNWDVFRQSVSFITQWEQRCRNIYAQICRIFSLFSEICRIFDKSKLLGVHLYPPASLASRSSIEIQSLLFMVLSTGTQQLAQN